MQAGLVKHWMARSDFIFDMDNRIDDLDAPRKIVLNVMQLFFAYILLFVGCAISTIFFFIEIVLKRK